MPSRCFAWLAAQPWCTGRGRHRRQVVGRLNGAADRCAAAARARRRDLGWASTDDRYGDRHPLHRRRAARVPGSGPGHRRCWPTTRARRTPCSWATAGARCGSSGSTRRRPSCTGGSRISAGTTSGSTARCARTTRISRCRSTWSAAGQDGYTDAIFRFMEGYGGVSKGLAGRGATSIRTRGYPSPRSASCRTLCASGTARLKGIDNGMLSEPPVHAWIQEWVEPSEAPHVERPGRWGAESAWPPVDRPEPTTLHLRADGTLAEDAGPAGELPFAGLQHTGLDAGASDGLGLRRRRPARPAGRRRALALLHLRPAARAHRDAGASRRRG